MLRLRYCICKSIKINDESDVERHQILKLRFIWVWFGKSKLTLQKILFRIECAKCMDQHQSIIHHSSINQFIYNLNENAHPLYRIVEWFFTQCHNHIQRLYKHITDISILFDRVLYIQDYDIVKKNRNQVIPGAGFVSQFFFHLFYFFIFFCCWSEFNGMERKIEIKN